MHVRIHNLVMKILIVTSLNGQLTVAVLLEDHTHVNYS